MYRSITLAKGSDAVTYACGTHHTGLWRWDARGADWRQQTGTGQTPRFRDHRHLSRWIRRHYAPPDLDPLGETWAGWRMIGHCGWED